MLAEALQLMRKATLLRHVTTFPAQVGKERDRLKTYLKESRHNPRVLLVPTLPGMLRLQRHQVNPSHRSLQLSWQWDLPELMWQPHPVPCAIATVMFKEWLWSASGLVSTESIEVACCYS